MKYKAKSVRDGKIVSGSLVVFEDKIKTGEPGNKDYYYKGFTDMFIVESSEMTINYCTSRGYIVHNVFVPVVPESIEPIEPPQGEE